MPVDDWLQLVAAAARRHSRKHRACDLHRRSAGAGAGALVGVMSSARVKPLIPAGEATELPDDEAWRALFDVFGAFGGEPTEPMQLELEPLPEHAFAARVRAVFRSA